MSNLGDAVIALAIGAGGGFLLWRHFRDDKDGGAKSTGHKASNNDAPAPPPRTGGGCSLKLDATGLTAEGKPVDVPTAVARCKPSSRADLVLADDAPAQVYVDLSQAFAKAGIPLNVRRP